ncbi:MULTISPECIES: phage tail protein [unclassified Shewanella]|jgi:microcystin-dependent protein|uniref:phage tail protein n=1 Tax=Shewanella TaxID=22 RepID=UPI0010390E3F|nr:MULTISPECIES: tail fiber protein [unclassified Shewanella]MCU7961823.1 tail fiber protein [Shewanella sp. SW32]MCU7970304.1 tail fiber protein [Shewanella sp. SW29]MCU8021100.1 tail fiber protein [Shewanella sp. SM78]MCU8045137.1 tail fiber protein [Shewanella sp. SM68]MCU8049422.1 tail fiber protein [Shewanella sp. SM65]
MSDFFLGEIKLLPYNWAPKYWTLCAGQLLPINTNQALFSLLGTTYGGDGINTFALPDLRGRVPVHPNVSAGLPQGSKAGVENVTLVPNNLPVHNHLVMASSTAGDTTLLAGNNIAAAKNAAGEVNLYGSAASLQALDPATVSSTGGNQAHENCQPSLVMNYCIATQGIYPSRN